MSRILALACLAALVCTMRAETPSGSLQAADAALQAGEADKALTLLDSLPASAEQHNLRCRVRFALEQWDAALGECEHAVSMEENNSRYHMWLARVLGEKASRASFMSAFSLANGEARRTRFPLGSMKSMTSVWVTTWLICSVVSGCSLFPSPNASAPAARWWPSNRRPTRYATRVPMATAFVRCGFGSGQ